MISLFQSFLLRLPSVWIACVQKSPAPSGKIERGDVVSSPDFSWGRGDVCTQADVSTPGTGYNLGQNSRWKICTPLSPPRIKDRKMVRFGFCAASSLIWWGWGFAVPFYSVQDCSKSRTHTIPLATQASIPTPFICRVHPAGVTHGNVYTQRLHFSFSFSAR